MNKVFLRMVAFVLLPCLVSNPALSMVETTSSQSCAAFNTPTSFLEQAMMLEVLSSTRLLLKGGRPRRKRLEMGRGIFHRHGFGWSLLGGLTAMTMFMLPLRASLAQGSSSRSSRGEKSSHNLTIRIPHERNLGSVPHFSSRNIEYRSLSRSDQEAWIALLDRVQPNDWKYTSGNRDDDAEAMFILFYRAHRNLTTYSGDIDPDITEFMDVLIRTGHAPTEEELDSGVWPQAKGTACLVIMLAAAFGAILAFVNRRSSSAGRESDADPRPAPGPLLQTVRYGILLMGSFPLGMLLAGSARSSEKLEYLSFGLLVMGSALSAFKKPWSKNPKEDTATAYYLMVSLMVLAMLGWGGGLGLSLMQHSIKGFLYWPVASIVIFIPSVFMYHYFNGRVSWGKVIGAIALTCFNYSFLAWESPSITGVPIMCLFAAAPMLASFSPEKIGIRKIFGIPTSIRPSAFISLISLVPWFLPFFKGHETLALHQTLVLMSFYFYLPMVHLFFHEMGHAFAAHRQGLQVKAIQLHGGGKQLESLNEGTPKQLFLMVAAGPAASIIFILVALLFSGPYTVNAMMHPAWAHLGTYLTYGTLETLLMNLVPLYTSDGAYLLMCFLMIVGVSQKWAVRIKNIVSSLFVIPPFAMGIGLAIVTDGFQNSLIREFWDSFQGITNVTQITTIAHTLSVNPLMGVLSGIILISWIAGAVIAVAAGFIPEMIAGLSRSTHLTSRAA